MLPTYHALRDCWDRLLATSLRAIDLDGLELLSGVKILSKQCLLQARETPERCQLGWRCTPAFKRL